MGHPMKTAIGLFARSIFRSRAARAKRQSGQGWACCIRSATKRRRAVFAFCQPVREDQAQLAFDEANAFVKATAPLNKAAHVVESELEIDA